MVLSGLLLAATGLGQYRDYSRVGRTPAELQFFDDPMEVEKKEPAWWFWNKPKKESAAEQLTYAAGLERAGQVAKAVRAYDDLVRTWHTSEEALYAQLAIARLESAAGHAQAAFDADIYLLAYFSGHFESRKVLEDAVAQADLMVERERGRSVKLRLGSGLRANYEKVIHYAPRWERVPGLLLKIAELYEADGEFASAITVCDRIFVDWPSYEGLDEVLEIYCGACRRLADQWRNDAGRLAHLNRLLLGAVIYRPGHPKRELFQQWAQEVLTMRRELAYASARFYDNAKAYSVEATIQAYQTFLRDFPDAPEAEGVRARLAELSLERQKGEGREGAVESRAAAKDDEA